MINMFFNELSKLQEQRPWGHRDHVKDMDVKLNDKLFGLDI